MMGVRGHVIVLSACIFQGALPAADGPTLSVASIVNAADHSSGKVAPGEIITLLPANAGPASLAGAEIDGAGRTTTLLGQTGVWFDGIAAPMVYSMAGRVGAVVPYAVANRKTTRVAVEYRGVRSPEVELPVVSSAPALFTLDSTGKGQAGMLNEKGCCNSAHNPAARGSIAALYATGAGQTIPAGIDGSIPPTGRIEDYPVPALPVRVTVGGQAAQVIYAGAAPHAVAGLLQVNFLVPANAPIGNAVSLVLTVGDSRSSESVTMAVRSAAQQVLLIGEEPGLQTTLVGAGYDVLVARDARHAVAQAEEHPIDLIMCSLTLPEEERIEAMRGVLAARPQVKIVATADALSTDTLRAADLLGAQAVLTKPMAPSVVLHRVRELLRPRTVPYVALGADVGPMGSSLVPEALIAMSICALAAWGVQKWRRGKRGSLPLAHTRGSETATEPRP
jgi:uncharacterized protein (TIGR03437 family)